MLVTAILDFLLLFVELLQFFPFLLPLLGPLLHLQHMLWSTLLHNLLMPLFHFWIDLLLSLLRLILVILSLIFGKGYLLRWFYLLLLHRLPLFLKDASHLLLFDGDEIIAVNIQIEQTLFDR